LSKTIVPGGNDEHEILAVLAEAVLARTVSAARRLVAPLIAEVEQRRQVWVDLEDDAAAPTAVASVGAAIRHILLCSEGRRAVPAVACLRFDFHLIDKHL
jgi:hypothetical protein